MSVYKPKNYKFSIFVFAFVLTCLGHVSTQSRAQVTADFSVSRTSGCSPFVVNFIDQSTGNPTSWEWDFGNGNSSTSQNPSTIYSAPGSKTITLIVSDGSNSDTIVMQNLIQVNATPNVDFTATPTEGCEPITVDFTDQSSAGSGTITSWIWDFPGGSPGNSGAQNPTVDYNQGGSFRVTLIVRNSFGCQDFETKNNYINVTQIPVADFTSPDTLVCQVPEAVDFIDQSQTNAPLSHNWDFGDGSTDTGATPTHTYDSTGVYDVTLDVITPNGCADTITKPAFIDVDSLFTGFTSTDTVVCAGIEVRFTRFSTGPASSNQWVFETSSGNIIRNNVTNTGITYNAPGSYDVTHIETFTNGCTDTVLKQDHIEVLPRPTAGFSTDSNTIDCEAPLTVNFADSSANATSWSWNFGDGNTSNAQNPTHTYTSEGNFNVSLTVTNSFGCQDTEVKNNFVNLDFPDVSFTANPTSGCNPVTVNFSDQSSAIDPIASWNWDFDDDSTSSQQNPTHTYSDSGSYNPTLTITTNSGCVDSFTISSPILVGGDTSSIDFSANPTQPCWQDQVSFTDLSSPSPDSWLWDFGDGGNSNLQNPTYAYDDTGSFDVTLIASFNGCQDTLTKQNFITVNPPVPDFVFSLQCNPALQVPFTDQSEGADLWEWDFDDGDSSSLQNPVHNFPSAGQYDVTLTVTDTNSGCQKTRTRNVQVSTPAATFSSSQTGGCIPFQVNFNNTSSFSDSTTWFIPPSNPTPVSFQDSFQFTFNNAGIFDVMLVNCDAKGCCDTIIKQDHIVVNGPQPDFTIDTALGCLPHTVSFTDQSTSQFSNIVGWQWNFGDGQSSSQQDPTHTYTQSGSFDVTLSVTDTFGCTNSITKNNFVDVIQPVADFSTIADTFCQNQTFNFNNQSTGTQLSYEWDFGDGSPIDTSENPSHLYANNGTFTVNLTVTDIYGCDSAIQNSLTVQDPNMGFFVDDTADNCPPFLVDFTDTTSYTIPATNWRWEFGDSSFSNQQNASHIYTEPGVYDVSLFVEFANGCKDTVVKQNLIELEGPNGNLTFNPQQGCTPVQVCFDANSDDAVDRIFDFGDGTVQIGPDSICHTYTDNGIFFPSVLLSDSAGCSFLLDTDDSVVVDTPIADFGMSRRFACQPATIFFTDSTTTNSTIIDYEWEFGDGATDTVPNPTHVYDTAGTFTVSYTVTNAIGCENTVTDQITIHPQPDAKFTASDTVGCVPLTVQFADSSTADTNFNSRRWYFGDSTTSTAPNPTHQYDSGGVYTVRLIVTDQRGCADTAFQEINVLALPIGITTPDTTICRNDTIRLQASQGDSLYNWSPGQSLSDSTISDPLAFPDTTTYYSLNVTSQNGCPFRDTVLVEVLPLPDLRVSPSPDTFMCFGDTVQVRAQGQGISFDWTPASGLFSPDSSFSKASPASTTTYTVTNIDTNSCANKDSVTVIVNRSIASFEEPVACLNDTTFFTDQSINIGGQIIEWQWDFGDGSTDTVQNPTHQYNAVGAYPVNLHVRDNNGCEDDTTVTVQVNPLPTANFSVPDTLCAQTPARFRDLSFSLSGLLSWSWNFGDGSPTDSSQDPVHSFPDSGFYDVSLTVTDSNFCQQDTTIQVFVESTPNVSFVADNVCFEQPMQFFDSTRSDTLLASYNWDFGDGNGTSALQNPSYIYDNPGMYGANLEVTDINGCRQDTTINVTVWELPNVDFQAEPACLGDSTVFLDQTLRGDAPLESWSWDFGDGIGSDTGVSPVYTYIDSGFYDVTLMVTDTHNCMNNITRTARVDHPASPRARPDTLICKGESVQLQGGGGDTIFWTPSEGLDDASSRSPVATPQSTINYTVNATNGVCPFDTAKANIEVIQLPTLQAPEDQRLLRGDSVRLSTFANSTDSILWEPTLGLSCTTCVSPIAAPLQTQRYRVRAIDQYGCVNRDSTTVTIFEQCEEEQVFVPNTFTPNGDGLNDELFVRTQGIKELLSFRVFNRWGELMFETENVSEGWDGTNSSGEKLNSGVYVYSVQVLCFNNVKLTTSGNVTIVK